MSNYHDHYHGDELCMHKRCDRRDEPRATACGREQDCLRPDCATHRYKVAVCQLCKGEGSLPPSDVYEDGSFLNSRPCPRCCPQP